MADLLVRVDGNRIEIDILHSALEITGLRSVQARRSCGNAKNAKR